MQPKKSKDSTPRRYLGLELAGAKNPKTTLTVLEHYPRENKLFLLEAYEALGSTESQTADEFLLDVIAQSTLGKTVLGVSSALTYPPCTHCAKNCSGPGKCHSPSVKWMREASRRADRKRGSAKEFTPYTQRPIELYLRYEVLPELKRPLTFEIDETLGGSRAPLTARMIYLARHLKKTSKKTRILETLPKLTLARLAPSLKGVTLRSLQGYRHLEHGAYARSEILEALSAHFGLFIYDGDLKKLSRNLNAFDALLCGLGALLAEQGRCAEPPKHFPKESGWVYFPK